jgi:hypothetical protein
MITECQVRFDGDFVTAHVDEYEKLRNFTVTIFDKSTDDITVHDLKQLRSGLDEIISDMEKYAREKGWEIPGQDEPEDEPITHVGKAPTNGQSEN